VNKLLRILLATTLLVGLSGTNTDDLKLPNLGEVSGTVFSAEKEHRLGRAWLRMFRGQVPTSDDPLLADYFDSLIFRLATFSQVQDRRLSVVVVDNQSLNAFAVPGGVIGVHTGLLVQAESEDEVSAVLAHELAHLSQRHFSRGIEAQQRNATLNMAGMLAGLVLIATTGSDAGLAALTATQAAALESRLRYSRGHEQEADRIGMQTMVEAGMDPHAVPTMFERMLKAARYYGRHIPEFLLTHPVTESRIADTKNRARKYPRTVKTNNLEYHLMRARARLAHADDPQVAAQDFRTSLRGKGKSPEADRYGLALALNQAGQYEQAAAELAPLLAHDPGRLAYIIAQSEIDIESGHPDEAAKTLLEMLQLTPGNYPLGMTYAKALLRDNRAHVAEEVLLDLSKRRPTEPAIWYILAEAQGLSGNILGLHQSRAEFFILRGVLDEATRQLEYALKLTERNYQETEEIRQRIQDVLSMQNDMEL
jgi:predicted Zn-dependent protease